MAVTFFPPLFVVDVPNPGYGELMVSTDQDARQEQARLPQWSMTLNGPQIGQFLTAVTQRALTGSAAAVAGLEACGQLLPAFVTVQQACALLPSLQQAAILAVAGTGRYERVFPDPYEPPPRPMCSRCGAGDTLRSLNGPRPGRWCLEHGHQPFGMGASTGWDVAGRTVERQRREWRPPAQ